VENAARGGKYSQAWQKAIELAQGDTDGPGNGNGGGGGGVMSDSGGGKVNSDPSRVGGGKEKEGKQKLGVRFSDSTPPDVRSIKRRDDTKVGSAAAAMQAVHSLHSSNSILPNSPTIRSSSISLDGEDVHVDGEGFGGTSFSINGGDLLASPILPLTSPPGSRYPYTHPPFSTLPSTASVLAHCAALVVASGMNTSRMNTLLEVKDVQFNEVKKGLAAAEAAVRLRDEEVASQRHVMRYLVDSTVTLREEIKRLKRPGVGGGTGIINSGGTAASNTGTSSLTDPNSTISVDLDNFIHSTRIGSSATRDSVEKGFASLTSFPPTFEKDAPPTSSFVSDSTSTPLSVTPTYEGSIDSLHFSVKLAPISGSSPPLPKSSPKPFSSTLPTTEVVLNSGEDSSFLPLRAEQDVNSGGNGESEEVEFIVDKQTFNGKEMLKVHWRGSSSAEDEWFCREDLLLDFPGAVRRFEASK